MNHCPDCGEAVEFQRTEDDAATIHTYWHCPPSVRQTGKKQYQKVSGRKFYT